MIGSQECGAEVRSDAKSQEIDRGEGRAVVIDEVAPVASKVIETRSCVIGDYAGGGIALGSKPITNNANALASAEMGSHHQGTANGLVTEDADQGADVGGEAEKGEKKMRKVVVEHHFHRISNYTLSLVIEVPAELTDEQVETMIADKRDDLPQTDDDGNDGWVGEEESECDCNHYGKSIKMVGDAEADAEPVALLEVDEKGNWELFALEE